MSEIQIYDLSLSSEAFDSDETLRTAITFSLLSDARAQPGDFVPDSSELRGWWGDTYAENPGDAFGSRIWLLHGQPITAALIAQLDEFIHEALQWLVDDGHISGLTVELAQIRHGVIGAKIGVRKPAEATVTPLGTWELSLNAL